MTGSHKATKPRLVPVWRLYGFRGDEQIYVGLRGSHLLCRGDKCVEVVAIGGFDTCRSRECEEFIKLKLDNERAVDIADSPAERGSVFDLPVRLVEVERLARDLSPMPGCSSELVPDRERMRIWREILKGSIRAGDPRHKWEIHLVEGGLVLVAGRGIALICLRPECDRSYCKMGARATGMPKPLVKLMEAAEELAQLAQAGPETLIGVIATLAY